MPQDSVSVVKAVYDAYARRDIGAIFDLFHPEVEIRQTELLPWGGRYHGHEGLRAFLGRLTQAIDSRVEHDELIDAGDRVVSVGRTRGQVRANGAPFDVAAVHVFTIADGKVRRYEAYIDTPAMLRALTA